MGTAYAWNGSAWVAFSLGGGGDPPPDDPPELLERFTFPGGDLTGWTIGTGGEWSEGPTDWVTAYGNGVGYTFLRRTMPGGTVYAEMDCYLEDTGEQWAAIRLHDVTGAIYDSTAYGVLVRGNGAVTNTWAGGADDTGAGAGDLTGADVPSPDIAHAITLGLWIGTGGAVGITECYVDGVMRKRQTGQSDLTANTLLTVGCYNGAGVHINEVRCYSGIPA